MHINILHRPEPDSYRKAIFKMQQDMVHNLGLRATILATAPALEDDDTVALIKMYKEKYNDEIGISFHTLNTPSIKKEVGFEEICLWLYNEEDKRKVIRLLLNKFREVFGFEPISAASYHFDSSSLKILLEECPSIKAVVGGCFEEGVRVYHGCNHSWYLFNEGMPWAAWYPSKTHSLRPAKNESDSFGVVAIPHLTRDLVLGYESRNDFWASHSPNVQRGMGNKNDNCPYDKNLVDQHRYQERFNNGYSYLNIFVSAQWLIHNHNSEEAPEISVSLYRQQLEHAKAMVDNNEAQVSTMSEFAEWYKENVPVAHTEVALAKEILYGSGKHYFWYVSPQMRVLVDLFQGCSIGDLRPYIAEVPVTTGSDSPHTIYGSYPYLVQSQHRTGYLNHCSDGSRSTAILKHGNIEVDMADVECKCDIVFPDQKGFVTKDAKVHFGDKVTATMKTTFRFEDNAQIIIERELVSIEGSDNKSLEITEYFKGCYGITDYPEDMSGIQLSIDDTSFKYGYKRHAVVVENVNDMNAAIPAVNTIVGFKPADGEKWKGEIAEGILFNPYYTFKLTRVLTTGKISRICLYLKTTK